MTNETANLRDRRGHVYLRTVRGVHADFAISMPVPDTEATGGSVRGV
jgi:hypothetical protein